VLKKQEPGPKSKKQVAPYPIFPSRLSAGQAGLSAGTLQKPDIPMLRDKRKVLGKYLGFDGMSQQKNKSLLKKLLTLQRLF